MPTLTFAKISFEEASVKIYTYQCGCEVVRCLEKQDCTAKHKCEKCRSKIFRKHCGTHQGLPAGVHSFSWC